MSKQETQPTGGGSLELATKQRPQRIEAKPLRHPGRWVLAAVLLALAVWFVIGAARNEAYGWSTYFDYLLDTRIATAALHTIAITVPVSYTHLTLPTNREV